ncbi:hypothetical protein J6E39_00090 [bacterium]|nr:hypothetical protein [bacterium]
MENHKKTKKLEVSAFDTSSEMVAGVHIERVWNYENKYQRTSTATVLSIIRQKKCFSRDFMEKTMGLTTAQAYWYIKQLLKTGMIKKLRTTEYVGNKGKQQALYKVKTERYI